MATVTNIGVTGLKFPGTPWCINFSSSDSSTAETIKSKEENKRIWIEKIHVTSDKNKWFKILDGENVLIGPLYVSSWKHLFVRAIHGSVNTALKIHTESAFDINVIIEGFMDTNIPSASVSASVSASPS